MKKIVTCFLLTFSALLSKSQCVTQHTTFQLSAGITTVDREVIKSSQEIEFLDPTFIDDDDPTLKSSIGSVTIADFSARTWNRNWHDGTGRLNGNVTIPIPMYDDFYLIDMVPLKSEQILWIQKVEVEPGVPYHLTMDLANISDPNRGVSGDVDVAVRVYDGRPGLRELGRWFLPQSTPTGTNATCGMPWEIKEVDDIYFQPLTGIEGGVAKQYAYVVLVGFDAFLVGADMALDNICLSKTQIADDADLTVTDHCSGEDLEADLLVASPTDISWWVDGTELKNTMGNPINSASLNTGTHSIDPFGVGKHTLKVTYKQGGIDKELYKVFVVTDASKVKAFMEYTIDDNGGSPKVVFNANHGGKQVKFYQYTSINDINQDSDADGKIDGTSTPIGQEITKVGNEYSVPLSSFGTDGSYFCKYVEFGCSDAASQWAKDCGMICSLSTTAFELTQSSISYNTSTDQYDVTFSLTDPSGLPELHWNFDHTDNGTNSTLDELASNQTLGAFDAIYSKTFSFDQPGHYYVCVVGQWYEECVRTACLEVTICEAIPSAGLAGPSLCFGGFPDPFDADPNSNDIAGTEYRWFLDDELVAITQTYTPTAEEFEEAGDYELKLIKTTACTTSTETTTITIREPERVGLNWASQNNNGYLVFVSAGRAIQFDESYKWYVDAGSGYQEVSAWEDDDNPSTPYDFTSVGSGTYKIKLEITNENNQCTWTAEKLICVAATPKDCCNCPAQ